MNLQTLLWLQLAILAAGTIYAWYNWYLVIRKKCTTCSIAVHENPFMSKCFWGALFFTAALAIHLLTMFPYLVF